MAVTLWSFPQPGSFFSGHMGFVLLQFHYFVSFYNISHMAGSGQQKGWKKSVFVSWYYVKVVNDCVNVFHCSCYMEIMYDGNISL